MLAVPLTTPPLPCSSPGASSGRPGWTRSPGVHQHPPAPAPTAAQEAEQRQEVQQAGVGLGVAGQVRVELPCQPPPHRGVGVPEAHSCQVQGQQLCVPDLLFASLDAPGQFSR